MVRELPGKVPAIGFNTYLGIVETRVLTVNADPVFQDRALAVLDQIENLEIQIVRNLSEAVQALLEESFDGLIIEGDAALAVEQATNLRQHFPSLTIACLLLSGRRSDVGLRAKAQNIELLSPAANTSVAQSDTLFANEIHNKAPTAAPRSTGWTPPVSSRV